MICCAFCTFCIYTSAQIIIIIIIGSVRFDFVVAKTCKTLKLGLLAEPKVIIKNKKKAPRVIISLLGCILSHCKLKICVNLKTVFWFRIEFAQVRHSLEFSQLAKLIVISLSQGLPHF